jgi:hypothetical protein
MTNKNPISITKNPPWWMRLTFKMESEEKCRLLEEAKKCEKKKCTLDRLDILNKHKSATVDAINLTKKENEEKCRG